MTAIAELPPGFSDKVLSAQATFRSGNERDGASGEGRANCGVGRRA